MYGCASFASDLLSQLRYHVCGDRSIKSPRYENVSWVGHHPLCEDDDSQLNVIAMKDLVPDTDVLALFETRA